MLAKIKAIYYQDKKLLVSKSKEINLTDFRLESETINKEFSLTNNQLFGIILYLTADITSLTLENLPFVKITANYNYHLLELKVDKITKLLILENLKIQQAEINRTKLVVLNSKLNHLMIGLKSLLNNSTKPLKLKHYFFNSNIDQLQIFSRTDLIKFCSTNISRFVIEPQAKSVNRLLLTNNTNIKRLNPVVKIREFNVYKSSISNLIFYPNSKINDLKLNYQVIKEVYDCKLSSIVNKDTPAIWKLLMNSAKNSNDTRLYSMAAYLYMTEKKKELNKLSLKIVYKLMDLSCGYGYKPLNTILTTLAVWFIFGLIYFYLTISSNSGISLPDINLTRLDILFYSLYYSTTTLTTIGYGDLIPQGRLIKLLSGLEAALGITLFSIFIFALTERFGHFK